MRIISYIFFSFSFLFLFSGFLEVVFLKNSIPALSFNLKCTLGLVSLVIAQTLYKANKIKTNKIKTNKKKNTLKI